MFDKTILLSSYKSDPFGVSESYIAFLWLNILLKKFNIILLTTIDAEDSLKNYYQNNLPENLKIVSFKDNYPFKSKGIVRNGIKLGYFYFNQKIKKYLIEHPEIIAECDILFHKTPVSFRYFTSLVHFNKPVYIGPLSGGLKPPAVLRNYFRKESIAHKIRNLDPFILRLPVYKKQFSKIEKVIVCFDYLDDILPKEYLLRKKILLDIGIDCSQYTQAVNNSKTTSILYVGRLTRYKGAELLIRSVTKIKDLDFVVNIVGDGEERDYLKNLVKEFKLEDKIKFHGFKPAQEVKLFYSSASVFCSPALTESIGIVFYEAMASGLPIITINNGGPKYICPSEGSIKIPITSEDGIIGELQESIQFLIENPAKRKEMGEFNRKYCRENYDWKILEKNILDFFSDEIEFHSKAIIN
jgi:glycosyltransferase involved in cell wall biosynthesis